MLVLELIIEFVGISGHLVGGVLIEGGEEVWLEGNISYRDIK